MSILDILTILSNIFQVSFKKMFSLFAVMQLFVKSKCLQQNKIANVSKNEHVYSLYYLKKYNFGECYGNDNNYCLAVSRTKLL